MDQMQSVTKTEIPFGIRPPPPVSLTRLEQSGTAYSHPGSGRLASAKSYGAGTVMTVFTMVIAAFKASSLPLIVVTAATPAVETEIPA